MKLFLAYWALTTLFCGISAAGEFSQHALSFIAANGHISKTKDGPNIDIESRIFGGSAAKPGQFPWQAALLLENQCFKPEDIYFKFPLPACNNTGCGASLISTRHLITAAHCLINYDEDENIVTKAQNVTVKLGSINSQRFGVDYTATYAIHPSWDPIMLQNDIGIIHLSKPYTNKILGAISGSISRIALPFFDDNFAGSDAIASGYGISDTWGSKNVQLNFVEMKVISNVDCNRRLKRMSGQPFDIIDESKMCTSNLDSQNRPTFSICFGDSGGPLTVRKVVRNKRNQKNMKDVLVGVSSFVTDKFCVNGPSVFTRITHFMPFILSHVPKEELDLVYQV